MSQTPNQDPWSTPAQGPQDAVPLPFQGTLQAPPTGSGYGYGAPQMDAPAGMYFDPKSGLMLPQGVELAGFGRRIGAYFLMLLLAGVTLGIGWVIWGLIAWSKGRGPAMQVLGLRCWKPAEGRVAGWGTMALRNIIGIFAQDFLSPIAEVVSFGLFLGTKKRQSLPDLIGSTVVLHDPNKVLDTWQR
ncbi:RDD family protein [Actinospica robiniae]|uniref:RDD family protein n=1 Tax=Actinospica robiniae TaxID=304901 RepID=UPI000403F15A|nr:RDD family protein [Actinospica robiniae]